MEGDGKLMYKPSMFNVVHTVGDRVLLYNSLTKRYLKAVTKKDEVLSILNNPDSSPDSPVIRPLVENGFLVDKDENETELFQLWRNDMINSPELMLTIMPTEQCNFRCVYCYEDFKIGAMRPETQQALVTWLRNNIHRYSALNVSWFGGEPLVEKDIIYSLSEQFLSICKQARKPYTATIITNGSLLDYETFQKLLKYHVTFFQVTIDGTKETHDKLKVRRDGSGSYDAVMNNIIAIKNNCKSGNILIAVRTNVTTDVVDKMPEHLKTMEELFGDDHRFSFYFRPVGQWSKTKEFHLKDKLVQNFERLYQPIIDANIHLDYRVYQGFTANQICATTRRNSYILRADGRIVKCSMQLDAPESNVGVLHDDGTMELDMAKIAKWTLPDTSREKCRTCNMLPACLGRNCAARGYVLPDKVLCGYEGVSHSYVFQLLEQSGVFELID